MSLRAASFLSVLALTALSVASCGGGSAVPNGKPDSAAPDAGDASPEADVSPEAGDVSPEAGDALPEAGDASPAGDRAGGPCDGPPRYCALGGKVGDVYICDDVGRLGICEDGVWSCPPSTVETTLCTCSGPHPANCGKCTPQGWACTDGGADASPAADAASDSACAAGCASTTTGAFCNAGEVQWTCQPGQFNPTSFNAYCRDAATNAVRYCCPTTFHPLCD